MLFRSAIIFFLALWKDVKRKFNTVSSKATEYKSIVNTKKEALTQKLEKKKPPKQDGAVIVSVDQAKSEDHKIDDEINDLDAKETQTNKKEVQDN